MKKLPSYQQREEASLGRSVSSLGGNIKLDLSAHDTSEKVPDILKNKRYKSQRIKSQNLEENVSNHKSWHWQEDNQNN